MSRFYNRMDRLHRMLKLTEATNRNLEPIGVDDGFSRLAFLTSQIKWTERSIFLIGNGASASMASHMAADLTKNGQVSAQVFSDHSLLTAIVNDIGPEAVFSEPVGRFAASGDLLIAISSSGASKNILNGVRAALENDLTVITFSGMDADNPLRESGHLNFYVPVTTYGDVETCHAALLHYWVDLAAGDISSTGKLVTADTQSNRLGFVRACDA